MHHIGTAIVGWLLMALGALAWLFSDSAQHSIEAIALLVAGLVLVIARAIAVRFDRIYPPE